MEEINLLITDDHRMIRETWSFLLIQHGASGYLTKSSSIEEMYSAILDVHHNRTYICQTVKDALADLSICGNGQEALFNLVTKRQIEVIEFIVQGYSSREIADGLKVGLKTIEVHRYHILKKLKLRNVAALVNYFNNNHAVIYR